ncbi:MAG: mucoidy inhibitor MuiA family protein [Planctomycetes bacterium]|nr:mucoidy inhibitor MuiA family protein [Planctomycetota bacterium]
MQQDLNYECHALFQIDESQNRAIGLFSASLLLALLLFSAPAIAQDQMESVGTITSVTLYQSNARVERTLALPNGEAGLRKLLVGPLPASLVDGGVQVEATGNLEVSAVQIKRISGDPIEPERIEELRKESDRLEQRWKEIARREKTLLQLHDHYENLLPAAVDEKQIPGVNLDSWKSLSTHVMTGMTTVAQQILELLPSLRQARAEWNEVALELREATGSQARVRTYIEVDLLDASGEGGVFTVQYLLPDAFWYPSYEIDVDTSNETIRIRSFANVQQLTGENWPQIPVQFSTSIPEMGADIPQLSALKIQRDRYVDTSIGTPLERARYGLRGPGSEDANGRRAPRSAAAPKMGRLVAKKEKELLKRDVLHEQLEELRGELSFYLEEDKSSALVGGLVTQSKSGRDQGISQWWNFPRLDDRGFLSVFRSIRAESIPSDGETHRLLYSIKSLSFRNELRCLPEIDTTVFRRIISELSGDAPLLAGDVSVFVGGNYLGKTRMKKTVAPGEELVLELGTFDTIALKRSVQETEETRGLLSKVIQYRTDLKINLENFGSNAELVQIVERIPFTDDERVSIQMNKNATNPLPVNTDPIDGILRWNVEVPPGEKIEVRLLWTLETPEGTGLVKRDAPERKGEEN